MGLLTDYFRAPDATAAAVVNGPGWAGPLFPQDGAEPFDGVEGKWIEPVLVLGQLVGFILGVPYRPGLVGVTFVHPPPQTTGC